MKKSFLFVAALALTFAACKPNYDVEDKSVATFEEAACSPANVESVLHLNQNGVFTSGKYTFHQEVQDWGEIGVYYFGNIVSNKTDTKVESYLDAEKSACGGAHGGKNFLVWAGGAQTFVGVSLTEPAVVPGMYINNIAWVVDAVLKGDGLSDAFGDNDFLLLTIKGELDEKVVATIEVYLAKGKDYIKDWTFVSLKELGKVNRIEFDITGSKMNAYGLTTPTYFCIDDFGAAK